MWGKSPHVGRVICQWGKPRMLQDQIGSASGVVLLLHLPMAGVAERVGRSEE